MGRKAEHRLNPEQGEPHKAPDPRTLSSSQREMSGYPQHAAAASSSELPALQSMPRSPTPTLKSVSASPSPPIQEANPVLSQLQVALKFLVSNSASGLIIGRSGSTISDLQSKSRTRIKLSQGGDYYPGTSDRVCLIQGMQGNASLAVEMVLAKLYELQSSQQLPSTPPTGTKSDDTSETMVDYRPCASFIVRLLVPSTCCGMIIGRGGSNVKSLKEKSGVTYIQLSPKEHEVMVGGSTMSTSERIMTVTGPNFASCVDCVRIVLTDMAQNPEISRYVNMTTSYKNLIPSSYAMPPAPGFFLDHEAFAHVAGQSPILDSPQRYGAGDQYMAGQFGPSSPLPGMPIPQDQSVSLLSQHLNEAGTYDPLPHGDIPLPLLGDLSNMAQHQPYGLSMMPSPPRPPDPMSDPMPPSSSSFPQYRQSQPSGHAMPFWPPDLSGGSPGILPSASGDLSSVERLTQSFQARASLHGPMPRHPSHSSLPQLASSRGPVTVQLGVPDNKIGSILGRGGKTLTEIQGLSQTKIRISQRGEFLRGTQNRIVTITGDTPQNVERAKHLVNQRLSAGSSRASPASALSRSRGR